MTSRSIYLVRHGRSAHSLRGWHDRRSIERWLRAYEDVGLAEGELPPRPVRALAGRVAVVTTSDLRRARESTALLTDEVSVVHVSALLREMPLPIPDVGRLTLPIPLWAVAIGMHWMRERRRAIGRSPEQERAHQAALWLGSLAESHGSILALTHSAFRRELSEALVLDGWTAVGRRSSRPWSVWELTQRSADT